MSFIRTPILMHIHIRTRPDQTRKKMYLEKKRRKKDIKQNRHRISQADRIVDISNQNQYRIIRCIMHVVCISCHINSVRSDQIISDPSR